MMNEFIKTIERMRDKDVDLSKNGDPEENSNLFFYLEGRIAASSDILLQYYFHYREEKEEKYDDRSK